MKTFLGLSIFLAAASAQAAVTPCRAVYPTAVSVPVSGDIPDLVIDPSCSYIFAPDNNRNQILVISTTTLQQLPPIPVGARPQAIGLSPDGNLLYVSNAGEASLSIIDARRRTLLRTITFTDPSGTPDWSSYPMPLKVASNGYVLFMRGGYIMQYDPVNDKITKRTDTAVGFRYAAASGDGNFIYFATQGYETPTLRYEALIDQLIPLASVWGHGLAVDAYGQKVLVTGQDLRHGNLERIGTIYDDRENGGGGVAIAPDGVTAYRGGRYALDVLDLPTLREVAKIPIGNETTIGPMVVSADGRLLAVRAAGGIILVTPQFTATASLSATLLSGAHPSQQHSVLRFHNTGTREGFVQIVLSDAEGGGPVITWDGLAIPAGAAHDYDIRFIEAAMAADFVKPPSYLMTAIANFPGTFTHLVNDRASGTLTNLSTCAPNMTSQTKSVAGVVNGSERYFESRLVVTNVLGRPQAATLALYDAGTGTRLGGVALGDIPSGGAVTLAAADAERLTRVTPKQNQQYVVKIEGNFEGFLQHVLTNKRTAVASDMTVVCPLSK